MAKQMNPWQFHEPTEAQKAAMQRMRDAFRALAGVIYEETPDCHQRQRALDRLEEAATWADKAANRRED